MPRPGARKRGYDTRWDKARATFLQRNPWCVICAILRQKVRATDVDHRIPHRGDQKLFWDKTNWRPVCSQHHKQKSGREAHGLKETFGCGADGRPLDPEHPWNR